MVRPAQSRQQRCVELLPHFGGLPLLQPAPAEPAPYLIRGHPQTTAHLLGQSACGGPLLNTNRMPVKGFPVVNGFASGVTEPLRFGGRQQEFHYCPQFIAYQSAVGGPSNTTAAVADRSRRNGGPVQKINASLTLVNLFSLRVLSPILAELPIPLLFAQ